MQDKVKKIYKLKIWLWLVMFVFILSITPLISPILNLAKYYNLNNIEMPVYIRLSAILINIFVILMIIGFIQRRRITIRIAMVYFLLATLFPFFRINTDLSFLFTFDRLLLLSLIFILPNIGCFLYLINPVMEEIISEFEEKRKNKKQFNNIEKKLLK